METAGTIWSSVRPTHRHTETRPRELYTFSMATVLHAVRKIGGERQKNGELNQQLHVLEQTLKG